MAIRDPAAVNRQRGEIAGMARLLSRSKDIRVED
jgi:hypothetical protein